MEEDLLNLAEVEISKSIVKLLRSEPFYAHVVANLSRKMDSNIPTMAVTYREEQLFLLINPSFLIHNLDEKQRVAVWKHEILHIIFKHLKRTTDKNPFVLNLAADIVVNSASSGYIVKINSLNISNITGTAANIIVSLFRSSTEYKIVHNVSVPANAAFTAIDKPTGIYLEEGDSLRLTAGTGSALHAVCSYEIIS